MSDSEEEPYSTIFGSLKHPIRRKILRMLSEKPRSFSEMLEGSEVSSSHLTYHLENLGELVSKTDEGKYRLSTFGEAAVATMRRIEETPTEPKHRSSLPLKWKSLSVALLIGVVILAGISYTQYQSLSKLSRENGQLVTIVTNPKQYILNATFPNGNITNPKLDVLNSPYPNGTIVQTGVTETCWGGVAYPNGTEVAYGPVVVPCHVVEMTNGALAIVPDYDLQSLIANSSRVITSP
jgi:DNA-binding transcriptional ArsR family regulator